jgi:hypothetical protein
MLVHTGFFHCRFVCKSRAKDPYSLVYAYFNAVSKNSTAEIIAETRGEKIY